MISEFQQNAFLPRFSAGFGQVHRAQKGLRAWPLYSWLQDEAWNENKKERAKRSRNSAKFGIFFSMFLKINRIINGL